MKILKSKTTPKDCPSKIPWAIIIPHHKQAYKNHGQSLLRLNIRGGVDIREMYAILKDIPYDFSISEQEATDFVNNKLKE